MKQSYLEKKKREENKRKVSRGMGGGEMESRFERSGRKRQQKGNTEFARLEIISKPRKVDGEREEYILEGKKDRNGNKKQSSVLKD